MRRAAIVIAIVALMLTGCAQRRKPALPGFKLRNCVIVERAAGVLSCDCFRIVWAVDAKTGVPVALCGAKGRRP